MRLFVLFPLFGVAQHLFSSVCSEFVDSFEYFSGCDDVIVVVE